MLPPPVPSPFTHSPHRGRNDSTDLSTRLQMLRVSFCALHPPLPDHPTVHSENSLLCLHRARRQEHGNGRDSV